MALENLKAIPLQEPTLEHLSQQTYHSFSLKM